MKITFCNTIKSWGGGEKWHYETACNMQEKGHDVSFICNPQSIISQKIKNKNIKKIFLKTSNLSFLSPIKFISVIFILHKINPDVIIINSPAELKIIAPAARVIGIKKIVYRRGSAAIVKNSLINKILLEKIVTHIIANSIATKKLLLETGLKIESKIEIIQNGVDISKYQKKTNNIKNKKQVIAAIGRLDYVKGFDLLILIADELKKRNSNFRIEIAGEGNERQKLEEMISNRNLENHVILKGFVDNIPSFLMESDIFILTSRYEGFGYVIVEAMLSQVPVIAYNISSINNIIEDLKTGYLIKPFEIIEFADALEYLLKSRDQATIMGINGYNKALENYSLDIANEKLINLIK